MFQESFPLFSLPAMPQSVIWAKQKKNFPQLRPIFMLEKHTNFKFIYVVLLSVDAEEKRKTVSKVYLSFSDFSVRKKWEFSQDTSLQDITKVNFVKKKKLLILKFVFGFSF